MVACPGNTMPVDAGSQLRGAGEAYGPTLFTNTAGTPNCLAYSGARPFWMSCQRWMSRWLIGPPGLVGIGQQCGMSTRSAPAR
jgi:hypothetical protein